MRSHWLWLAELSFPCPLAVIFNVSTCIQAREHDSNLCNGHRQDVPSRRCCGEHGAESSRVPITSGSRWQCSGLRCGRSSDSIAKETDSSPDPEEERQQHSALLCCPSLWPPSSLTPLYCLSQAFFFFGAKSYQEKGISRGLIDQLNAWVGFWRLEPELSQTSQNASMGRCHPPFFLFHYPLLQCSRRVDLRETCQTVQRAPVIRKEQSLRLLSRETPTFDIIKRHFCKLVMARERSKER